MTIKEFIFTHWVLSYQALAIAALLILYHLLTCRLRPKPGSYLFYAGVVLFLLVALSPLEYLGRSCLFSAHMVQHIFYLLVIPPLLMAGTDAEFLEKVFRSRAGTFTGKLLFYPLVTWILGIGSMWIWHIPSVFRAMKHSQALMLFQVISLLVLGYIFIWPVYSPIRFMKLRPLQSALYLFSACVGCTLLGILITFSPAGMYTSSFSGGSTAIHTMIVQQWGFTDGVDQQVAGLIMWVPACIVYLTNIMITLGKWYMKGAETGLEEY